MRYFSDLSGRIIVAKTNDNGKWNFYYEQTLETGQTEYSEPLFPHEFDSVIPTDDCCIAAVSIDKIWKFLPLDDKIAQDVPDFDFEKVTFKSLEKIAKMNELRLTNDFR